MHQKAKKGVHPGRAPIGYRVLSGALTTDRGDGLIFAHLPSRDAGQLAALCRAPSPGRLKTDLAATAN